MLRGLCVLLCVAAVHSAVLTISPHNNGACSSRCEAVYLDTYTSGKCTTIRSQAQLLPPTSHQPVPIELGFENTQDGYITLRCSCNDTASPFLGRWHNGTGVLSAELVYTAMTKCNIFPKIPSNFTCNKVDNFTCSTAQPKIVIELDTTQRYPRCDYTSCLKDNGWLPSGPVPPDYCKYTGRVYKCLETVNCVTQTDVTQCSNIAHKICSSLTCPKVSPDLCPQTPSMMTNGEWDCSNNTCTLLCNVGYIPQWKGGMPKEYAATCSPTTGAWNVNVKGCTAGSCDQSIKKYCTAPPATSQQKCAFWQKYITCADGLGCGPEVSDTCLSLKFLCPNIKCPSTQNLTCPTTPETVSNGEWFCANGKCHINCNAGYYPNFPALSGTPPAAVCKEGTWRVQLQTPGCKQCVVGQWSPWSRCTNDCGGGNQDRSRTISGSTLCTSTTAESRTCNPQPCHRSNCTALPWSTWSQCTAPCGGGTIHRTRTVTKLPNAPKHELCPPSHEIDACNIDPCPPTPGCVFSPWGSWGPCSVTCNGGSQVKTRTVIRKDDGAVCSDLHRTRLCNTPVCCPNGDCGNCLPGPWSAWGACSKSCGGGLIVRSRKMGINHGCASPYTQQQKKPCSTHPCSTCEKTLWTPWSTCSQSCGGGVQSRTRQVQGQVCPGVTSQTRSCNLDPCPNSCQYSQWGAWSQCTSSCEGGSQQRTRTTVGGSPFCISTLQERDCATGPCAPPPPPPTPNGNGNCTVGLLNCVKSRGITNDSPVCEHVQIQVACMKKLGCYSDTAQNECDDDTYYCPGLVC